MHSFKLNEYPAAALISRLGLRGKKVLGRGSFSAVFAHPDTSRNTVLKITTDKAGFSYLDEGASCYHLADSIYFPKVIDYHRDLNGDLIAEDSDFRVIELERLEKKRFSGVEARLVYTYASRNFGNLTPSPVTDADHAWAERIERKDPEKCAAVHQFATRLANFCADYGYRIDSLQGGNTLLRGDQPVFSDPVFCQRAMNAVRKQYDTSRAHRAWLH